MRFCALVLLTLCAPACMGARGDFEGKDYWQVSPALHGDVDGDGRRDRTYVAAAENDPCDLLLVVDRPNYYSFAFEIPCSKPSEAEAAPPFVEALADIDTEPGLEIVVEIDHGASRQFARLFTIRARSLRPIAVDGALDHLTIQYYGSAGTGNQFFDCTATRGFVVSSSRSFDTRTLVRTRYRVVGTRLKHLSSKRMPLADRGRRFRELRGPQPFPSCTQVRRPSVR